MAPKFTNKLPPSTSTLLQEVKGEEKMEVESEVKYVLGRKENLCVHRLLTMTHMTFGSLPTHVK